MFLQYKEVLEAQELLVKYFVLEAFSFDSVVQVFFRVSFLINFFKLNQNFSLNIT